ncbi:MAG: thioredoxin family protein, partial [Alphaproteobacteria bacterium]|nr:thioredoxin family protein [Alphaproteobacteria bacterium]
PALLVFEVMALGLALPFLLISFFPAALRFLPRPGAWMERLKELLAFPMYISATWLVWVLAMQAGADAVAAVLLTMQALAFLAWWQRGALSPAMMLAAAVLWAGGVWAVHHTVAAPLSANHPEAVLRYGEKYRAERLEALRAGGAPVFVDATAAWCITCQINDHTSLSSDAVQKAFAERHITMLVADWTRKDAEITALLERFGRRGVPLYVYFPPHGEPRVLPQLLTPGIVLAAIKP